MASGRFLSTSIAEDERLNQLSSVGELLYLKTIPHLDRDGMIGGKPGYLWGKVCPLREEMLGEMQDAINEWVLAGLVVRTMTDSGPVLFFPGFLKNNNLPHYKRERPSRFPAPSGYVRTEKGLTPIAKVQESVQDGIQELVQDEIKDEVQDIAPQEEDQEEDQDQQGDEEDARTRDPIHAAWFETFGEELPAQLEQPIANLLAETSPAAVIHGICASVDARSRSFGFIAKCARNYIPPAPEPSPRPTYAVDLPGVYAMPAAASSTPAKPLPPPLAHDDPWAVCLGELQGALPGVALGYLAGSRLEAAGTALATHGALVPFYRVVVEERAAAGLPWLKAQARNAINRKLNSILRHEVMVEIVVAELESTP